MTDVGKAMIGDPRMRELMVWHAKLTGDPSAEVIREIILDEIILYWPAWSKGFPIYNMRSDMLDHYLNDSEEWLTTDEEAHPIRDFEKKWKKDLEKENVENHSNQ